jgi:hypothetical protein
MRRLRILSLPKLLLRVRKLLLRYRLILWRHLLAVVRLPLRVLFLLLLIVGWLHIFESCFCNNNNKMRLSEINMKIYSKVVLFRDNATTLSKYR